MKRLLIFIALTTLSYQTARGACALKTELKQKGTSAEWQQEKEKVAEQKQENSKAAYLTKDPALPQEFPRELHHLIKQYYVDPTDYFYAVYEEIIDDKLLFDFGSPEYIANAAKLSGQPSHIKSQEIECGSKYSTPTRHNTGTIICNNGITLKIADGIVKVINPDKSIFTSINDDDLEYHYLYCPGSITIHNDRVYIGFRAGIIKIWKKIASDELAQLQAVSRFNHYAGFQAIIVNENQSSIVTESCRGRTITLQQNARLLQALQQLPLTVLEALRTQLQATAKLQSMPGGNSFMQCVLDAFDTYHPDFMALPENLKLNIFIMLDCKTPQLRELTQHLEEMYRMKHDSIVITVDVDAKRQAEAIASIELVLFGKHAALFIALPKTVQDMLMRNMKCKIGVKQPTNSQTTNSK